MFKPLQRLEIIMFTIGVCIPAPPSPSLCPLALPHPPPLSFCFLSPVPSPCLLLFLQAYRASMLKAYRRVLEEGRFSFIIGTYTLLSCNCSFHMVLIFACVFPHCLRIACVLCYLMLTGIAMLCCMLLSLGSCSS